MIVLLMLLRPLSGAGALAAAGDLLRIAGPDSLVGRMAAVMIGSSETSFYVVAVYFAAAKVRNSRRVLPAALFADLVCFLSSAWICRLLWG
jgi:spore maturation protein B